MGSYIFNRAYLLSFIGVSIFAIYFIYSLSYYGIFGFDFINYVKVPVFAFFLVIFFASVSRKISKFVCVCVVLFVLGGGGWLLLGFYYRGVELSGFVHLLYFSMFFILIYLGGRSGLAVSSSRLCQEKFLASEAFWKYGVLFSIGFLLVVNYSRVAIHNPSITFPFLCIAFPFLLWRKSWIFVILCTLAIALTLKRGMWVSFVGLGFLIGGREILKFIMLKQGVRLQELIFFMFFTVIVFVFLIGGGLAGPALENLYNRIEVSIPTDFSYGSLDLISSGRFGDAVAVYSKVTQDCHVLWGCGFGVEYNYFDYNNAWDVTSSWVKGGSDVMVLHLFLLFGAFGAGVYLGLTGVFCFSIFSIFTARWDSLHFFAGIAYFLVFVTSFFSFSFFDPLFPGVLGFYLAVLNFNLRKL